MTEEKNNTEQESQVIRDRRLKAESIAQQGVNLFPNTYRPQHAIAGLHDRFDAVPEAELEAMTEVFVVAGRIMAKRDYGKSLFVDIKDQSGKIQLYFRKNDMSADDFQFIKKLDIGDIIGASGRIFRTRTGELTILSSAWELVTKSLLPLPEKFHEINVELRYRQRYVDMIMNDWVRELFVKRARIVELVRSFLSAREFIEVETPMMQPIPGGATARPFETWHHALGMKLYMRIAPELYLKRLLVGGFNKVFELNRNFRNEGIDTQHNPEFTMLEFYQAYADFTDNMDLTEAMFVHVARELLGDVHLTYQEQEIDLTPPWRRVRFHDSLLEIGGAPEAVLTDKAAALAFLKSLDTFAEEHEPLGKLQAKIFDLTVEPRLVQPTFVTHYPTDISPLARRNAENPEVTDRFELFITAREMANGFSELNDPLDQRERFLAQVAEREAGDDEAQYMDEDYVRALMYGMPPAAGEGIGIDRLVMLMTDAPSIREVIVFPHQRPER